MNRGGVAWGLLLAVLCSLALVACEPSRPEYRSACDLLSADEIATTLRLPVAFAEASDDGSFCVWNIDVGAPAPLETTLLVSIGPASSVGVKGFSAVPISNLGDRAWIQPGVFLIAFVGDRAASLAWSLFPYELDELTERRVMVTLMSLALVRLREVQLPSVFPSPVTDSTESLSTSAS